MKKVLLTVVGFGLALGLNAQEAAEKKVQAGLVIGAGMNFQKMGTNKLAKNGVGSDLTVGANVNIGFNKNIGFCTGLEFDFSTTRFKSNGNNVFYRFDDKQILRKQDETTSSTKVFSLTERSQKGAYITIPTMMLFRTNYIGYFRYFGKFGLRNSFLAGSKIKDEGTEYASGSLAGTAATNEGMKRKNEMWFYKGSVGLAGGAEWNFSGSTCLVAELGYYYGFTPLYYSPKEDRKSLYSVDATGASYFSNAATQSQLMLKISILF